MVNVAVLVVSSKIYSGEARDKVLEEFRKILEENEAKIITYEVVPDDRSKIRDRLRALSDSLETQVVFTVGGTGVRPTDWVPEATRDVIDREVPGIGEAMRSESFKKVRTAMLSRGIAGIRRTTLIVNLPGSSNGVRENLAVLLPILGHTLEKISHMSSTS